MSKQSRNLGKALKPLHRQQNPSDRTELTAPRVSKRFNVLHVKVAIDSHMDDFDDEV